MNRNFLGKIAFSLIELMIVITIIGVLAAVAVPSYQNYIVRTKVAAVWPVIKGFTNQMIDYYYANGVFPDAGELGLAASGVVVDNPSNFHPLIVEMHVYKPFSGVAANCGGGVVAVLSGSSLGISANNTWGFGGAPNHLAWAVHVNVQSNQSIITYCGLRGNVTADYQYIPTNCTVVNPGFTAC